MNKKGIIGVSIAIVVIIIAIVGFSIYKPDNISKNNNLNNIEKAKNENTLSTTNTDNMNGINEDNEKDNKVSNNQNKTLIVYYSAQTHTKAVTEKIAKNLNADIFEIVPEIIYTSEDLNWNNNNSRVSKEHNDKELRNVKLVTTEVKNWEDYDTILIGYPIWWGIAAWPVNTFVKSKDFNGKTVIPFCTSASSDLGQSGKLLEQDANSGNWLDGHRFNSNPSDYDIKQWTDSLK